MAQTSLTTGMATETTLAAIKADTAKPQYDAQGKLLVSTPATDVTALAKDATLAGGLGGDGDTAPANGTGVRGWLRSISDRLNGTLNVAIQGGTQTDALTNGQLRATAVPVAGPLTDAQLRTAAVPVSTAALPLPAGAATESTLGLLGRETTQQAIRDRLPIDATTSRLAVALPPGGGGLTNTELRAAALPVTAESTQLLQGAWATAGNAANMLPFSSGPYNHIALNLNFAAGGTGNQGVVATASYDGGTTFVTVPYRLPGQPVTYNGATIPLVPGTIGTILFFLYGATHFKLAPSGSSSGGNIYYQAVAVKGYTQTLTTLLDAPVLSASAGKTATTETVSNLAAGATYTGPWRLAASYPNARTFATEAFSDVAGTLYIDLAYGFFNYAKLAIKTVALDATVGYGALSLDFASLNGYRARYVNGATATNNFAVTTAIYNN